MPARTPAGHCRALLGLGAALAAGCAQISAEVELHTVVRPDAQPILREERPVRWELAARWTQRGRDLELELYELRGCKTIEHMPARQVERIVRRPDAMIYWEYGLAAAALGVSALAFARPELFAGEPTWDAAREQYVLDPKRGYRLGGVFTAIGAGFLAAGIVDTVRARDQVRSTDVVTVREGAIRPCDPPTAPVSGRDVALAVEGHTLAAVTDGDGRARFVLPAAPEEPEDAARSIRVIVRVGTGEVLLISLVVPFAQTADAPHTGSVRHGPE